MSTTPSDAVPRGVDLNAIPSNMIERIEILRDGAAAQYGSDAIAGVINIILKSSAPPGAAVTVGSTYTTFKPYDAVSAERHRGTWRLASLRMGSTMVCA